MLLHSMNPDESMNIMNGFYEAYTGKDALTGQPISQGQAYSDFAMGSVTFFAASAEDVYASVAARISRSWVSMFANGSETKLIAPNKIRFSQETVSYKKFRGNGVTYTIDDIRESMSSEGWNGQPIDVVRIPEGGYTSLDNTRLLAARYADIDANVVVHNYNERLPLSSKNRFDHPAFLKEVYAQTWGEALEYRIMKQSLEFQNAHSPVGTYDEPRVTYPRKYTGPRNY